MHKNLYYTIIKGLDSALTIFQILGNDGDLGSGPPWERSFFDIGAGIPKF